MPITRPAPERSWTVTFWTINELENDKGWEFISPQGYIFGFSSKDNVLAFVANLSWGGHVHDTMYGDIHCVKNGIIEAWQPDPWINGEWEHLAQICRVAEFTTIAMKVASAQWIN